jgi:hypothetical protein
MVSLTATQKKTAEAIVNIFETHEVLGDYRQVTLIADAAQIAKLTA